ncbi:MAG: putative endonuclease [Rhodobacteraceae bacterium HLUCCA08]|nr:MAG: putative endonuclease [Rhodobacteraceae bacterium HLUCCA08]
MATAIDCSVQRGRTADAAGRAAESIVAADYDRRGRPVIGQRWRGLSGEIDLIARDGDGIVFIEVKKARDHARAAAALSARQMRRLCGAAAEFLETQPKGQLTEARFDVALVDGTGRIDIIENAFGA